MLITSDLHLTDRERDEYRWQFFSWLEHQLLECDTQHLLILGDLTDAKDGHSATLVNRIVNTLTNLPAKVTILKGNHDYVDENTPFFGFLNEIPNVEFIIKPTYRTIEGIRTLLLPHTRTPEKDWQEIDFTGVRMVCCHQTFDGAATSNGYALPSSISSRYFRRHGCTGWVFSGDIHVPQQLGDVTYVGTPYPVAFGDDHDPRILAVSTKMDDRFGRKLTKYEPIRVPTIRKRNLVITAVVPRDIRPGDQVKVRVQLPREEFAAWEEHKHRIVAELEYQGAFVHSIELEPLQVASPTAGKARMQTPKTPADALAAFSEARGLTSGEHGVGQDLLDKLTEGR